MCGSDGSVGHDDGATLGDHRTHLERADRDAPERAAASCVSSCYRAPRSGRKALAARCRHCSRERHTFAFRHVAHESPGPSSQMRARATLSELSATRRTMSGQERSELALQRDLEQEVFQRIERWGSRLREEHRQESSSTIRDHRESSDVETQDFAITWTSRSRGLSSGNDPFTRMVTFRKHCETAVTGEKHSRHSSLVSRGRVRLGPRLA